MKTKVVDTREYVSVLQDLTEEGRTVSLLISGNSMSPFLVHERDYIFFRKPENELKKGDMAFFVADADDYVVCTALGAVRKELAARFDLIDKNRYDLLWVVDFPLFEYSEEEGRYVAMHHPFTSPKDEDLPFMESEPSRVRAKAYDIVINGQEAGGGSLRIYKKEIQNLMFKTLGFSQEQIENRFGFFVNAFNFGTPPHGGIALGLDRFAMLLANTDNIKDVIAFPKVQNASCLMTEAPGVVENRQLEELAIELKDVEEG